MQPTAFHPLPFRQRPPGKGEFRARPMPSGRWIRPRAVIGFAVLLTVALSLCGCTPFSEYIQNGFKVGPNYRKPPAPVAVDWIDAQDKRLRRGPDDLSQWWKVFHDPVLDNLICSAYRQNLTLRQAGFRVLEARAQLGITVGNIFPQLQNMTGSYERDAVSAETANRTVSGTVKRFYGQWNYGFNLAWELDFWGRFRRAIESDSASLDASVEGYDDVLVTLLSDVATAYVQMRTLEKRIAYARKNVAIQRVSYDIARDRKIGNLASGLDVDQALSTLRQTEAIIPVLETSLRQTTNQLCILLGIPPEELRTRLGPGDIPTAPPDVVVGIPADLLRRRPDVREAERLAAAQSARLVSPSPRSILTSPSWGRLTIRPNTSRICSLPRPSAAASRRDSSGTSSTMGACSITCVCRTPGSRSWWPTTNRPF